MAQMALVDIKEHYEYYRAKAQWYYPTAEEKERRDTVLEAAKLKRWYVADECGSQLILQTDEGRPFQFWAPWCG